MQCGAFTGMATRDIKRLRIEPKPVSKIMNWLICSTCDKIMKNSLHLPTQQRTRKSRRAGGRGVGHGPFMNWDERAISNANEWSLLLSQTNSKDCERTGPRPNHCRERGFFQQVVHPWPDPGPILTCPRQYPYYFGRQHYLADTAAATDFFPRFAL